MDISVKNCKKHRPAVFYAHDFIKDELEGYFYCSFDSYESPLITFELIADWWQHVRQPRYHFPWRTIPDETHLVHEIYQHVFRFINPRETIF